MRNEPCNLNLEEADLEKLRELDPLQTEGYTTHSILSIPVRITHTSASGKETSDQQLLTFQVLTRWVKSLQAKPKVEPSLESMRVCVTSEEDIFLNLICNFPEATFEAMKTKNQLNLHFNDFPNSFSGILKDCVADEQKHPKQAELVLNYQGLARLTVWEETEYKRVELVELSLIGSSIERTQQSIIYRYNFNRSKLAMLENSINSVYSLLAEKNPPLLSYIQKTVGDDS